MSKKDWDPLANENDYHNEVLSPFRYKRTTKIILKEIGKVSDKKKSAIDIGCGLGYLLGFLSKNFKEVTGVDISPKMIIESTKKAPLAKLFAGDMKKAFFNDKYDLAVAVNSFLFPKITVSLNNLVQLNKSLKKSGTFIGVFPAIESEIYGSRLIFFNNFKKNHSEDSAWENTYHIAEMKAYDLFKGTYFNKSLQKFYYEFELELLFKKSGFKKFVIKKLKYPWKAFHKEIRFKKEDPLWDWLVIAKK